MNTVPSESPSRWFVRIQGRILGPFDLQQLGALKARGQLNRIHEISTNRRTWQKASSLESLFPSGHGSRVEDDPTYAFQSAEPGTNTGPTPPAITNDWYYAKDGIQAGPTMLTALQQLIQQGVIGPDDMVWKEGFADWVPARTVPELKFSMRPPTAVAGPVWQQSPMLLQPQETNGLAVASLVLGLLWLAGLGSLFAIIFGAVAMNQIKRSRGAMSGKGMAVAGLVLGIVGVIPLVIYWIAQYREIHLQWFQR
jgi:hypothetical protein